jgi:hypothetical protein
MYENKSKKSRLFFTGREKPFLKFREYKNSIFAKKEGKSSYLLNCI